MTWHFNEIVRSGNSQARVKNFYPETGLVVLYDIRGTIGPGSTIIGDDSGTTLTLTQFNINLDFDLFYEPNYWESFLEQAIYDGNGDLVATEAHFTGKVSQDYQITHMVIQD
jgi:hypothetical protein